MNRLDELRAQSQLARAAWHGSSRMRLRLLEGLHQLLPLLSYYGRPSSHPQMEMIIEVFKEQIAGYQAQMDSLRAEGRECARKIWESEEGPKGRLHGCFEDENEYIPGIPLTCIPAPIVPSALIPTKPASKGRPRRQITLDLIQQIDRRMMGIVYEARVQEYTRGGQGRHWVDIDGEQRHEFAGRVLALKLGVYPTLVNQRGLRDARREQHQSGSIAKGEQRVTGRLYGLRSKAKLGAGTRNSAHSGSFSLARRSPVQGNFIPFFRSDLLITSRHYLPRDHRHFPLHIRRSYTQGFTTANPVGRRDEVHLARALAPHIDGTGDVGHTRTLSELTDDPDTKRNLWRMLRSKRIRRSHFLLWRDVLSAAALGDVLDILAANPGPALPAWVLARILLKPAYPGSAGRVIEHVWKNLDAYDVRDQADLLNGCLKLVLRNRLYNTLAEIIDRYLAVVAKLVEPDARQAVSSAMDTLLQIIDQAVKDGRRHGAEGVLTRNQLARIITFALGLDGAWLSGHQLHRLFSVSALSLSSIHSLLGYLVRHGIRIKAGWARNCAITAQWAGRGDLADKFRGLAEMEHARKSSSEGNLRGGPNNAKVVLEEIITSMATDRSDDYLIHDLGKASRMRDLSVTKWERLSGSLTAAQMRPAMMAPIMYGYLVRGRPEIALERWEEMLHAGHEPDVVVLTVAAQALLADRRLQEAIRLVDRWAVKTFEGNGANTDPIGTVPLDIQAVNVLLEGCNRANEAKTAYRIWRAMRSRWNVTPDAVSLAIMVATGDYASRNQLRDRINGEAGRGAAGKTLFSGFVSEFKEAFGMHRRGPTVDGQDEAAQEARFTGVISQLLPSGTSNLESDAFDWRTAARLFEDAVVGKWPDLELGRTGARSGGIPPAGPTQPIAIHPNAPAFHAYITLLGHRGLLNDVMLAVRAIKTIYLVPERRTLLKVLSYADRETVMLSESLRSWAGRTEHMRGFGSQSRVDELRSWLVEWLGKDLVPSDGEVQDFVRGNLTSME